MSSLTQRIKSYLDAHSSQWIPATLLYSMAEKNNYSRADIKQSLSDIAHTLPYATWSVSEGDYHASKEPGVTGKGVYYRSWVNNITPTDLARIREGIEAFDAL